MSLSLLRALCVPCYATGWICEAHPDHPWPHDDCPGPGMPCPACQDPTARPALPEDWVSYASTRR